MSATPPPPETWRDLLSRVPDLPPAKLRWWLSDRFDCPLTALPLDSRPTPEDKHLFLDAVSRLRRHEPVQYICGKAPFMDFEVRVTPDVLIPRPETEQLVDRVLSQFPASPLKVLDVGTGSGCIAIALKRARPAWHVHACDVSENALRIARENARILGTDISFSRSDLLHSFQGNTMEIILANLPYIGEAEREFLPPEVREHEPPQALFAGENGTALVVALIRQARHVLRPGGQLYLETGEQQTAVYQHTAASLGWSINSFCDLAGRERFHRLIKPAAPR